MECVDRANGGAIFLQDLQDVDTLGMLYSGRGLEARNVASENITS